MKFLLETVTLGAALLGLSYLWFDDRNNRALAHLYCIYWTLAVIGIYLMFRDQQSIFYSSDQVEMQRSVFVIRRDGVNIAFDTVIGRRYIVSLPATALSYLGFSSLVAYKFLQGLSVLFLLRVLLNWSHENSQPIGRTTLLLAIGPTLLLNSVLALRDSVLASSLTLFFLSRSWRARGFALIVLFGLRPQLAVAVILGVLAAALLSELRSPIVLGALGYGTFVLGAWIYSFASSQVLNPEGWTTVSPFSIQSVTRLLTSFAGLQFLVVNPDAVNLGLRELLALRLLFIDTLFAPLIFVFVILLFSARAEVFGPKSVGVLYSACMYFGIASQTDFTSSRQTMPFFATFAIMAATVWREAFASRPGALLPIGRSLYPKR